eukprot:12231886-Ditylum_brightwellii.AAC.1
MQVALNEEDEYGGGLVVFCTADDGFVIAPRPAGSYSIHTHHIVHGVSALTRGVRYSLFLCNTSTSEGFGGEADVTGSIENLTLFLLEAVPAEINNLNTFLGYPENTTDADLA